MTYRNRNLLVLSVGIVLGASLAIGHGVLAEKEATTATAGLPVSELRTFTEVFSKIKSDYVEPIDDKTLLDYAIKGMLAGLDPHSSYLDKEGFKELQVGTSGEFGGLGIEVTMENGFVKVMSPIDDTPAQRAGINAGDLIIRLDDTPVKGLTLKDAVDKMRGKPGTNITITVMREGQEKPLKFTLTRAIIKVKSVKSRMLEPGFGYLRITQFQSHTAENLLQAVNELKKENGGKLNGVVLDLRNNPGGVLNGAVAVSDAFLESGMIVYTEGRTKDAQLKFNATPSDVLNGAPIIVLINAGSASASEIVAGALQDHKRAIVMGGKSFGKGSVQTIVPVGEESALKLTTARYFTPSGRSIQAEGITPDITLENLKVAQDESADADLVKEADLTGHLSNGNKPKPAEEVPPPTPPATEPAKTPGGAAAPNGEKDETKAAEEPLAKTDYQLYEALNLLKGLHILGRR